MEKLLILGGNALSCDIVETAQQMGIRTIVTDWYNTDRSPAKRVADEAWNISTTDYEKLAQKIKTEQVTGILTGFSDSYLLPYHHLCEAVNLPCYATKDQFEWTLDKARFKAVCRQHDVPVVPEYDLADFSPSIISKSNRIIIKPVDNSGSRGICLCDNPSDFPEMLENALSFSEKKKVVLERYMDSDDVSFEYTIQDGEAMLSAICDRYIYKTEAAGSVTSKLIYPSKYIQLYMSDVDRRVRKMFRSMGLRNGVLFMQAFVENGQFYFYEMGYRLSGGRHYIFTEHENGRSAVRELIHFAVSGKMADRPLQSVVDPCFKDVCCQLSILGHSGKIQKIVGQDALMQISGVIDSSFYYKEGEVIGKEGTTAQIVARIHIIASSELLLNQKIGQIYNQLHVMDETGNHMVIT